jgi:hypothetical protein
MIFNSRCFILVSFLISFQPTIGQDKSQSLIKGSEKPNKIYCTDKCTFNYNNYIVYTKENDEVGEAISFIDKKTNRKNNITNFDDECFFEGIHKNYIILSCGTDVIRGLRIYDINKKNFINLEFGSVLGGGEIVNSKLLFDIVMSDEKLKKLKLKNKECKTQVCGYYEKVIFDFTTQKITSSGKNYWLD